MNATAVRKFCTIEEAAERLHITQAQIEKLLVRGLLKEFRNGPHRLLRTADVDAIVEARNRRLERQGLPLGPDASRPGLPRHDDGSSLRRSNDAQVSAEDGALRKPPSQGPKTRTARSRAGGDSRTTGKKRQPTRSSRRDRLPDDACRSRRRARTEAATPKQSQSVREWFWNGLLQDCPIAIALLSAIVLLVLSGLVAGICWLTDTFR